MGDALIKLLQGRTVLITAGKAVGTGTLIAPGMVLTCAHVIRHVEDQPQTIKVSLPDLKVPGKSLWTEIPIKVYLSNKYEEPYEASADVDAVMLEWLKKEYPDVAVLKIGREDHDIIKFSKYNDSSFDLENKQFLAFGFQNADRDLRRNSPEAVSLIYSGEQVDGIIRKLVFVQGQIRPGMSGAGLIERESGQLIGIVHKTKSPNDDLGAYVIPAETIWRVIRKWHDDDLNELFISLRSKDLEAKVKRQYLRDYPQFSMLRKHWVKFILFLILIFFSLFWGLFHTGWTTNDPITSIIFLAVSSLSVILGGWLGKNVNEETGKFKDKVGKILLGKFGTLFLILWSIALIYFWSFRSSIWINGYSESEDVEISVMGGANFQETIRTITLNQDEKDGKVSNLFYTSPFDRDGKKVKLTIKDKGRSFYLDTLKSFHKVDVIYPRDFPLEPAAIFRFDPGLAMFNSMDNYRIHLKIERGRKDNKEVILDRNEDLEKNTGSISFGRRINLIEREIEWKNILRNELNIGIDSIRTKCLNVWQNTKYISGINLNPKDEITISLWKKTNPSDRVPISFVVDRDCLDKYVNQ